ncbi:hypothetical protein F5B17DRAFT_451701 [Nemania serpens]|nr:hypothetical protein F5B17DRAFT_451701 [Nemania serpens]
MKEKLAIHGYGRFLPGGLQAIAPIQRDGEFADVFAARLDKWGEKCDMAIAAIRSRLSTNAFQRTKVATLTTPALLWAFLQAEYKPKGKAQFAQYYRKWEETTVESTGSVTKFAAELRQIQADMTDLDANSAWPQSHVVRKFINGLSPDFNLFLAT